MSTIQRVALANDTLLARYQSRGYVDCFEAHVARECTLATFVTAFYTTRLFKLERLILRIALARPSTDDDASRIATGLSDTFAAWHVEAREQSELLLCDLSGRTRSWFAVFPSTSTTRLCFGSAVVAKNSNGTIGIAGSAPVLGVHQLYSRALLRAALKRLNRA
ncbi:MAG: hypothetical protein AAFO81_03220 [Pseudomonadota bacterium]